jgi:hypothetical protein
MDNDPKFMERFLGLVQGVKSGSLNLQIDTDEVTVSVGDNSIKLPMHLFLTSDVKNLLVALGERDKNED